MNKNKHPFPQANDFEKILLVVNVENSEMLKDYSYMGIYLGDISARQVDYYISACKYLRILDENKFFTKEGIFLRTLQGIDQYSEISRLIVSDEIFGAVYFQEKFLGYELEIEDVVKIMKRHNLFENEAMYHRRASTVLSWVRWINEQITDA